MDKAYDVIIIGSGIGGLTAGNFLAQAGFSTLILEQDARPGGCARSFDRAGFRFDAGVHWIAQCGEGGVIYQILQELGLEKKLDFARIVPPLTVAISDRRYIIPSGKSEAMAYLKDRFPKEREGLERFFSLQGKIAGEMVRLFAQDPDAKEGLERLCFNAGFPLRFPHIARFHRQEGAGVVDRLIQDRDLRKILKIAAIFPRVSMVMLSWFWEIIAGVDCYYPKGGVQRIADALAENFKQIGGEILCRRKAVQILTKRGRADGVKLSDGTLIRAQAIVSNADARQTFLKMLSDDKSGLPRKYREQIERWRLSESFFYVYLGVNLDMKAAGLSGSPILWYFPEKAGRPTLPDYIGMSVPSLSDERLAPSGMHTVVIGAFADGISQRWFGEGGIDPGEYQRWKEEIAGSLIRLAGEAIPDLERHIVVREAASPLTFHRYTGNSMGASSGWSMDAKEQNKLPQKTPLQNLFLAGHWTFNPGGMPAAFMTGRRAAELVRRAL